MNTRTIRFQRSARPTHSPWGAVDHATEFAPGIWHVETASHGGIYLSAERRAAFPDNLWGAGAFEDQRRSGWFEEDCDWCLVYLAFFREEPNVNHGGATYRMALECAKHWHPKAYAA